VFPLNLPNVLTVLRIMLVPALVVALLGNTPEGDVLAAPGARQPARFPRPAILVSLGT
jgi:phosphatidylglycerophosphate synthase